MSATEEPDGDRPPGRRRAWLSFLLNLFLAPAGYVYAGFPLIAITAAAGIIATMLALAAWTISAPPGVYGLVRFGASAFPPRWLAGAWAVTACMGLHAAWLSRPRRRWSPRPAILALAVAGAWPSIMVVALMLRMFAPVATYRVASASMEPTLSKGDIVLASGARALCEQQRVRPGQVILFRRAGVTFVGRAVAEGGTTIRMANGLPIVGGRSARQRLITEGEIPASLDEPALEVLEESLPGAPLFRITMFEERQPQDSTTEIRVPPRHWFILGDNRDNSRDSRFDGAVSNDNICGVVQKVLWSAVPARIGARP